MRKKVTKKEIAQILELEKKSFEYPYDKKILAKSLDYFDHIILKSKQRRRLQLRTRDRIVSYLLYKIEKDGIFIRRIAVLPEQRDAGYGKKMINRLALIAKRRKLKRIYAFSRISNLKGLKFFKKMDFKIKSRIDKYYPPNNETAYILERKI